MIVTHGSAVSELSASIGRGLGLPDDDLQFLQQAAMLHDIGICKVHAPDIGLYGGYPYIMHGILGREILEQEGYPQHALVCERHIGVGLTEADIIGQGLPLPLRDMTPQNTSEEIVCFADLFYSKKPDKLDRMKSVESVRRKLAVFGEKNLQIFDSWLVRFGRVFSFDGIQE
ncbi:MAG: HD domain-containing protein [Desulfuromonadales bacterium]|nr:HD domain-containing protein [Desulfuromonadales bacterium]